MELFRNFPNTPDLGFGHKVCTRCKKIQPNHLYSTKSNGQRFKICRDCKVAQLCYCHECKLVFWPFDLPKHEHCAEISD